MRNSILVTSYTWSRGRLLNKVDFDYFGRISCHVQILLSTYLVWLWSLSISRGELVQNIESMVKHNSHTLSKIHALKCILLISNIWKHPQNGYKDNHEWKKNQYWSWCIMPPLSKEKGNKKKMIWN